MFPVQHIAVACRHAEPGSAIGLPWLAVVAPGRRLAPTWATTGIADKSKGPSIVRIVLPCPSFLRKRRRRSLGQRPVLIQESELRPWPTFDASQQPFLVANRSGLPVA